ncbi:twin-arginine translocation signal domain-containing protein [Massilia sp. TS11]|uniref:twin-arginine translocation signal domain-containing protein n=1 Tax=Massilia sp. TS11 TaxID=2908003 RepID=UPI001EDAC51C|nr:twin-arginine translocation signal domain-containing protein [Massilia sp. TS11]MCG2584426.1 twin-arginine translocation signal domain-containing protein [Massilia sp. TS11]
MGTSRRSFLKLGLAGAAVLAIGGGVYRLSRPATPAAPFVLDAEAVSILDAIIPAVLAGALPTDAGRAAALASTRAGVQRAILGLTRDAQQEVRDLFGLLALGPVRRFLAGVPASWPEATPAQVSAFLQSWRTHRIAALRPAYAALHDLIIGAWYGNPASWAAIGYPGPIKELS